MSDRIPHLKNVPGDFYVGDGCCITCTVPYVEAPELFGGLDPEESDPHCYVKRQPQDSAELRHMLNAMRCAETECIRYRGSDRQIQSQLVAIECGHLCDNPDPEFQPAIDAQAIEGKWRRQEWQAAHPEYKSKPWWRFWR